MLFIGSKLKVYIEVLLDCVGNCIQTSVAGAVIYLWNIIAFNGKLGRDDTVAFLYEVTFI